MPFADATGQDKQPYKYNNKELDGRNGLDMYDYSARWKDDFRFTTIDPMAEKYYSISPYAYCANNPLKYTDPNDDPIRIIPRSRRRPVWVLRSNNYNPAGVIIGRIIYLYHIHFVQQSK
jgi:RHS repeat-associated protein